MRRQDAGREAGVERVDLTRREELQQPELGGLGADGDRVEEVARRSGQPARAREHRVADRLGNVLVARRKRLGDEERIAAGRAVEL